MLKKFTDDFEERSRYNEDINWRSWRNLRFRGIKETYKISHYKV